MTDAAWGELARERRAGVKDGADDVLVGRKTSVFERVDALLVRSGVIAAALLGVVDVHEGFHHPLYVPVDVALRIIAACAAIRFTVRVLRTVVSGVREGNPERHAIVLLDDALVFLDGRDARVLPRKEIVAVVEDPPRPDAPGSVSLIVSGDGPCLEVLPQAFARPAAATARRLERYVGPVHVPESYVHPAPGSDPSGTFDAAKRGQPLPGCTSMHRTRGWLLQGPYAGLVIVLVLAMRAASGELVFDPPLYAAAVLCVGLPVYWVVRGLRSRRSRLAFVATPAELLVRARGGVHRFPWPDVIRIDTVTRATWNVLTGLNKSRAVVVEREDGASLLFDERELPVAAHHVRALFEAYLDGLVPASAWGTPPSQGSGGGGGISSD